MQRWIIFLLVAACSAFPGYAGTTSRPAVEPMPRSNVVVLRSEKYVTLQEQRVTLARIAEAIGRSAKTTVILDAAYKERETRYSAFLTNVNLHQSLDAVAWAVGGTWERTGRRYRIRPRTVEEAIQDKGRYIDALVQLDKRLAEVPSDDKSLSNYALMHLNGFRLSMEDSRRLPPGAQSVLGDRAPATLEIRWNPPPGSEPRTNANGFPEPVRIDAPPLEGLKPLDKVTSLTEAILAVYRNTRANLFLVDAGGKPLPSVDVSALKPEAAAAAVARPYGLEACKVGPVIVLSGRSLGPKDRNGLAAVKAADTWLHQELGTFREPTSADSGTGLKQFAASLRQEQMAEQRRFAGKRFQDMSPAEQDDYVKYHQLGNLLIAAAAAEALLQALRRPES